MFSVFRSSKISVVAEGKNIGVAKSRYHRALCGGSFGLVLGLFGCASVPTHDPEFASVRPVAVPETPPTQGAVYQAGNELFLFEDLRARRPGDMLTIVLVEKTDASKKAETMIDKTNETSIANPTLLGSPMQFGVPNFFPLANTMNNSLETGLSSSTDFEGTGKTTQSNSLSGEITVTVAEVLANGNLVVRGEKLLTLNQGHEHIRVSGIVRPADIGSDNSVLSTKVADAKIVYAGEGAVADANALGWLSRFFISIFFPF
ncbi:MAG: flagellar basal body L-ring protein FlgH [Gammaproteobacteria bacterium]|jgi:flagellar L-ring protein precursor FlgH